MDSEAGSEPRRRILLVDDERNIRRLIGDVLRRVESYDVETAGDGVEALELLEAHDFGFDLIVTDMQMPRLNGKGLIEAVMQKRPEIPIVVLTAHKNDRNVVECLELGSVEYLTKPIGVDLLLKTVRRVFDRHQRFRGAGERIEVKSDVPGWVELTSPTDFEYVERFHKFTSLLGTLPIDQDARDDIRVAVDEIGQNAVEWGNRHDRSKKIRLSYCVFKDRLVLKIEDEGEGFRPEGVRDPSVDPLQHIMQRMQEGKRAGGYGIFMTRKLMDDILYNEKGNTVLMTKFFRKSPSS